MTSLAPPPLAVTSARPFAGCTWRIELGAGAPIVTGDDGHEMRPQAIDVLYYATAPWDGNGRSWLRVVVHGVIVNSEFRGSRSCRHYTTGIPGEDMASAPQWLREIVATVVSGV